VQDLVRVFERFRDDYHQHNDRDQEEHSAENWRAGKAWGDPSS
jgi:hypothetical protein